MIQILKAGHSLKDTEHGVILCAAQGSSYVSEAQILP